MLIYLFANCASIEKKRSITDDHRSFVLEERNDPRLSLLLRQERRPEVWDITVTLLLAKGKSGSSAFGRRWIHKSEGRVSRWKSANRFDLHPFRNDSGPRAWLPLVTNSDFLENAKTFPTSVLTFPRTSFIAFISRYMCTYTHVHTRQPARDTTFIPLFIPWLNVNFRRYRRKEGIFYGSNMSAMIVLL